MAKKKEDPKKQPAAAKPGKGAKDSKDSKGKGGGGGKDAKKTDKSGGGNNTTAAAKGAQTITVRHILCGKHSRKEEALAKINAGESFADVAREYSEDKARQGGLLGKKTKGSLEAPFEEVAFKLPVGQVGEAKTVHGYHLIVVEHRE
ncbi:hypothetical protein B0T24DRAFT_614611 [Lasiosphaeria ovina]|uniref:Peptidyl-prolyl cis-trans isomerase n=1 Tax=Lasiosphaeria ovina TaxID=92902 RepID=A0AAE0TUK1_9PEZI|nr:hypothetical protein B0T24DRAFT_614611 [Lasiosphaeria ovina]